MEVFETEPVPEVRPPHTRDERHHEVEPPRVREKDRPVGVTDVQWELFLSVRR